MDLSKQNLLNPTTDSHSEVGLNLTELSPLYLHDSAGFCGTAFYDPFNSQLYFSGSGSYGSYFNLINGYSATLMNLNVATPLFVSFPSEDNTNVTEESSTSACQLEYPKYEYLQNESVSPVDSIVEGVSKTSGQQMSLPKFKKNDNAEAQIAEHQEFTYEAAIDDKKVYSKPTCPFTYLVALALKNSRTGALPVTAIYTFISRNLPYYRTAPKGWKSSVRHNLSFNSIFEKIETTRTVNNTLKRKSLWTINPTKLDTK